MNARRWNLTRHFGFDRDAARYLWRFGKSIYPVRALELLIARLDRPLIGGAVSLEALGLYHQARYLASLPALAVAPGNLRVAVATYSRLRGDAVRTGRAFGLVQYFVVRATMPFAIACAVWPTEVVGIVFGARWVAAASALRILAVFAVAFPALESYRALLTALEKWRPLLQSMLVQGVLLVVAFAVAVPRFGAAGAAAAAVVSTIGGLFLSSAAASACFGGKPAGGAFRATMAAGAAACVGIVRGQAYWGRRRTPASGVHRARGSRVPDHAVGHRARCAPRESDCGPRAVARAANLIRGEGGRTAIGLTRK